MEIHTAQAGCTHEITGYLYFRSPDRDGGIINPDSDLFCGCPSEVAGMKVNMEICGNGGFPFVAY